jgi:hypothetical protein
MSSQVPEFDGFEIIRVLGLSFVATYADLAATLFLGQARILASDEDIEKAFLHRGKIKADLDDVRDEVVGVCQLMCGGGS